MTTPLKVKDVHIARTVADYWRNRYAGFEYDMLKIKNKSEEEKDEYCNDFAELSPNMFPWEKE